MLVNKGFGGFVRPEERVPARMQIQTRLPRVSPFRMRSCAAAEGDVMKNWRDSVGERGRASLVYAVVPKGQVKVVTLSGYVKAFCVAGPSPRKRREGPRVVEEAPGAPESEEY